MEKIIYINLQLFADDEKTEAATPRRKEEAKKKGQVAKSQDLVQIGGLLVGIVMLKILFKMFYKFMYVSWEQSFSEFEIETISMEAIKELVGKHVIIFFMVVGPMLAAILISGLISNYLQVGFMFTTEPLKPSLEKISFIKGLKNLLTVKKLVELVKTIIKLLIISLYGYFLIKGKYGEFMSIPFRGFTEGFILIFETAYDIVFSIAIALFVVAVIDYFYQRYEFEKSIKMSKQEIKEEFKQTEGDPQIKSRMRAMQREMARKKMIQEVPKATVVITNPTHLSIALKYTEGMGAPLVLAKGADSVALRIREIAKENNVPIIENKPLARALYSVIEVDQEIPAEYYRAVAEVLALVMNK